MTTAVAGKVMAIKGDARAVARAVLDVASIVPRKSTVEAVANIMLQAKDGVLKVTGADAGIQMWIVSTCDAVEVESEGEALSPGDRFAAVFREKFVDGDKLSIEADPDAGRVTIQVPGTRVKPLCRAVEGYPPVPALPVSDYDIALGGDLLAEAIRLVSYACAADRKRQGRVEGVALSIHTDQGPEPILRIAATDNRRIALVDLPLPATATARPRIIVLPAGLDLLARIAGEQAGGWKLWVARESQPIDGVDTVANMHALGSNGHHLVFRLIEGDWPPLENALPYIDGTGPTTARAKVSRDGFMDALRRAAMLTSATSTTLAVRFTFYGKKGLIVLAYRDPDTGEVTTEVQLDSWDGPEGYVLGFNPDLVADAIRPFPAGEIELLFPKGKAGTDSNLSVIRVLKDQAGAPRGRSIASVAPLAINSENQAKPADKTPAVEPVEPAVEPDE